MSPNFTQQEVRAAIKAAIGGGNRQFNEDFHFLCDQYGIPSGQVNERLCRLTSKSTVQNAWQYLQHYGVMGVIFGYPNSSGCLPDPGMVSLNRQTYNAPATQAAAAGDPVGLLMPAQGGETIVNLLVWSDGFSNAIWTGSATVPANTHNDSGVGNTDGASPVADTLNAGTAGHTKVQTFTVAADTTVRTAAIDLQAGTATNSTLSLAYTGGNTYTASIAWSGGVPTVTHSGSAGASDVGVELQATGIYRVWVRGANDGRTSATFTIAPAAASTGTVIASRAQVNEGSTMLPYQPNAGCLGGSNRRTGGGNQFTWSQDVAHPGWTKTSTTVADDGTVTATAALAAHRLQNPNVVTLASTQYTAWFDVARTNHDFLQLFVNSSAGSGYVNFNVNALTKSESTATGTITDNGDGTVRISITYTSGAVTTDYPVLCFITSLAAARGENWTPVGTETVRVVRAYRGFGSSLGTYTRNMDMLGGLLQSVPLYQTTSGDRPLLAAVPQTQIRNELQNNAMIGAGGATLPTTWGNGVGGLAVSDITTGYLSDGMEYVDVRFTGAGAVNGTFRFDANTSETALSGQTWSLQAMVQHTSGSLSGVTIRLRFVENNSSGNGLANRDSSNLTLTASEQTFTHTVTLSNASTAYVAPGILVLTTGAFDFTLRFARVQSERAAAPTAVQRVALRSNITESGVQPMYAYLFDGTSDYLTPGVQSFGGTSLQANATAAFTIFFAFRTLAGGAIISQNNGAATAAQMFLLFCDTSTGQMKVNARGTGSTAWGSDLRDGNFHVGALRWNGTQFDQVLDAGAVTAVTWAGGSLAANTIDIAIGVGRVSTLATLMNGYLNVGFIDRAVTDAEMLNAVAELRSTYRKGL